jgi:dihydrofolate reductase
MVRQLKPAAEHDMTVGGADLAGQAIKAGLVDELQDRHQLRGIAGSP